MKAPATPHDDCLRTRGTILRTLAEGLYEAALPNVDEILRVEGIDVFFIGPSDLSQSMGHPGNPKEPRVARAIEDTLAKIVAAGKTPGMPATADAVQGVLARGVRYIYTHLPVVLATGAKAYFKVARPQT